MTNPRRQIVFVDDDDAVLQGLRRMLFDTDDEWDAHFFSSPLEAQQFMGEVQCDVIVADVRMREMDGIALLSWARDHHPAAVRILLTAHLDLSTILLAIPLAHTFMSKPCRPDVLIKALRRSCSVQSLLQDVDLRRIVGRIDTLPINPVAYSRLTAALANARVEPPEVAAIVCADIALSSKVLHLANNAFFGLPGKFVTVEQAVSFIGVRMLRKLVLSAEIFTAWDAHLSAGEQAAGVEQRHGMACATIAGAIVKDNELSHYALSAGLLHDVGKLVLAMRDPKAMRQLQHQRGQGYSLTPDIEPNIYGESHGRIGAYLLGLWGLQYPILEAVAHHHDPASVVSADYDLPTVVHVADALAHEIENERAGLRTESMLDMAHLRSAGVVENLPAWRVLSRRVMEGRK